MKIFKILASFFIFLGFLGSTHANGSKNNIKKETISSSEKDLIWKSLSEKQDVNKAVKLDVVNYNHR